jgi:hypothetical protein
MNNQFRTETMLVTPDMARLWLQKNKQNRAINATRVKMYAKEMRSGKWFLHHQGIAFYEDGGFADGQHRLAAIIESGCSVPMTVTRGLPIESGLMIDAHQQRQAHQSIKISGLADWIDKEEVAIIRVIDQLLRKGATGKLSNTDVINIGEAYKSSVLFGRRVFKSKKRNITMAITGASIGAASKYEDHDRLQQFADVLFSGMPQGQNDIAAIRCREWLLNSVTLHAGTTGRYSAMKRIQRAIKAFCENEQMKTLREPSEIIYMPVADTEYGDMR